MKNDTTNEFDLRSVDNYPIYPKESRLYSDKVFVTLDDGFQGGSHWTCLIKEDNKSDYFDGFGGQPDTFLLNQLPEPTIYHNNKIQDIKSNLYGSYCFFFFYLIE